MYIPQIRQVQSFVLKAGTKNNGFDDYRKNVFLRALKKRK
jgi:hypothetical protein